MNMKPTVQTIMAAVIAGSTLLLQSCSSVTGEQTTSVSAEQGIPGGAVRQTTQVKATVTAVDPATRKVSLVTPAGEKRTITAGPEVINFPQIRVGDQLVVTYVEEVVARMAKSGEKLEEGTSVAGVRHEPGAKPGAAVGQTSQITATVTEIDAKGRKVRLQFKDGSAKKIKVRDDIDLSRHQVGEVVVIRYSEALAIKVEKP